MFVLMTKEVIRLFEGGYYHPDMFLDGRIDQKYYGTYENSGETMFGLDRYAGHGLYYSTPKKGRNVRDDLQYIYGNYYTYKTNESKQFWTYLDNVDARNKWKWGYRGGNEEERLSNLAAAIIYPEYLDLIDRFFNTKAKQIVLNSPELTFNFAYAVWNGSKFFQIYAGDVNKAVDAGVTDPLKLNDIVLNRRINGPTWKLPRTGKIMRDYFKSPEFDKLKQSTGTIAPVGGLGLFLGGLGLYWIIKKMKRKKG